MYACTFLSLAPENQDGKKSTVYYAVAAKGSRKNNFTFYHLIFKPSSACLPSRNPQNNQLFLWLRSLRSTKADLNLSENSVKLFLREPLGL